MLETSLQRPLQWLVRQLRTNELLLRHLLHVNGATERPRYFFCFSRRHLFVYFNQSAAWSMGRRCAWRTD